MSDLEFVQRCARNDPLAWNEFVEKYSRLIYKYINSVLKQHSPQDCTQTNISEIFQEILFSLVDNNFKKLKSFKAKNGCRLASWLRVLTINQSISFLRKIKPALSLEAENDSGFSLKEILPDRAASIIDVLSAKQKRFDLEKCVDLLDTDDRFFLEMNYSLSFSLEEIKDLLKVSRGAVDMRKSRILQKLKECFRKKGYLLDL